MNRSLNRPDLHRPVNNAIPVQKMQVVTCNSNNTDTEVSQLNCTRSRVRDLASGMRQLAGTKMQYRRAYAAPFASLISGREKYKP